MSLTGQDLRSASRLARRRVRPDYQTVTESAAKIAGYRPVTSSYSIRQYEQCEMLDRVARDFAGCDVLMVRNTSGSQISLWRKKS